MANLSQSPRTVGCPALGLLSWQQNYLTTSAFVSITSSLTLETLTLPFTIFLNILIILAIHRKHYLRRNHHVLLACLAGTDLLVGAVIQPLIIASNVQHILGVGPICLVDRTAYEIMYIASIASIFHLVIVSGERYIAIKHALQYEVLITKRRLTTAVSLAWAVSVLISLALFALELVFGDTFLVEVVAIATLCIAITISLLAIVFFQVAVLLECRRHRKHMKAHQISASSAKETLQKDKAARTTTIIVGTIFLCYVPQVPFYGIVSATPNFPRSRMFAVMSQLDMLLLLNSLVNPIIYCIRTQEFRRALKELLHLRSSQINPA